MAIFLVFFVAILSHCRVRFLAASCVKKSWGRRLQFSHIQLQSFYGGDYEWS